MNKKGSTLEGWTTGIIIAVLFVIIFGVVIVGMNDLYGKDHVVVGLDTSDLQESIESYQLSTATKIKGGESSFEGGYLILSTSWDVVTSTLTLIFGFLTGQWITTITTDYMKLPKAFGFILRSIYFISIGFIILNIIFRRGKT